ncbi:MAG TPA: hypothetical protein VFW71_03730 [Actinomycetota bacterium]|nr:hypothetical protein [Actinomycetota bacterium]
MFFWYLGVGSALLLVTLGPRRVDYRLALVGLVLPVLVDVPLRLTVERHTHLGVHLYAHTFAFAVVLALVIMFALRGATARRWFVIPMAVVVHLLLAGMLGDPVGLFWPMLGTHFTQLPAGGGLAGAILPLSAWAVVRELVGLAVLAYAAFAFQLGRAGPRVEFLRTGALSARPPRAGSATPGGAAGDGAAGDGAAPDGGAPDGLGSGLQ